MNETYVECLVSQKPSFIMKLLYVLFIMLTIVFGILGLAGFLVALIIAVVSGGLAYFFYGKCDVEYEYLYLDREISIDRIYAKSRRKRVGTYTVDRMEVFAPIKSYHLDGYRNRQTKDIDYSIGYEDQPDKRYVLYYEGGVKLLMNPTPEFVKAVQNVAPRKVYTD